MKSNGNQLYGNCDTFLYLGGNEQSTHKYISELLGKSTIDLENYSKTSGGKGSYSTNHQILGRELLTSDEVRKLDNRYAILFIRGEKPIKDLKYDIMKHPNIVFTEEGNEIKYEHGNTKNKIANIQIRLLTNEEIKEYKNKNIEIENNDKFELFSDEEIENMIRNGEL